MDEAEEAVERKLWWAWGSMSCVWWPLAGWVALPACKRSAAACVSVVAVACVVAYDRPKRTGEREPPDARPPLPGEILSIL